MTTIEKLNDMLKRATKLSDSQAKEAAALLLELSSEKENESKVADYLMRLKQTVFTLYFEETVPTLEQERIESLYSQICKTEAYKKNHSNAATVRGFILAAILIKNNASNARPVLMRTLTDVEKGGRFSDAVIDKFKQYVIEYCGGIETVQKLEEQEWDNLGQRSRFTRFMQTVSSSVVTIVSEVTRSDSKKIPEPSTTFDSGKKSKTEPVSGKDETTALTEKLIAMLAEASKEATSLLRSLREGNGIIAMLRKDVENCELRITELSSTVAEREHEIGKLQQSVADAQQLLHEKERKIDDLTERLKTAMQMDEISQNQELTTLKNDLKNSLKLEYSDYLDSKDRECNPDTYTALVASLTRIFKALRRFDISFE